MRRFRFRMERILRLRRQDLDVQRVVLAEAVRALQDAERSLETARHARSAHRAALARLLGESDGQGGLDGAALAREVGLGAELERRAAFWAQRRLDAGQKVDLQREKVVEAHRSVRVLEALRARRRSAYLQEAEREERARLDEVAGVGWIRRRLTEG